MTKAELMQLVIETVVAKAAAWIVYARGEKQKGDPAK
jgi:hypothetical protein